MMQAPMASHTETQEAGAGMHESAGSGCQQMLERPNKTQCGCAATLHAYVGRSRHGSLLAVGL